MLPSIAEVETKNEINHQNSIGTIYIKQHTWTGIEKFWNHWSIITIERMSNNSNFHLNVSIHWLLMYILLCFVYIEFELFIYFALFYFVCVCSWVAHVDTLYRLFLSLLVYLLYSIYDRFIHTYVYNKLEYELILIKISIR